MFILLLSVCAVKVCKTSAVGVDCLSASLLCPQDCITSLSPVCSLLKIMQAFLSPPLLYSNSSEEGRVGNFHHGVVILETFPVLLVIIKLQSNSSQPGR